MSNHHWHLKWHDNEYVFGAEMLRYAFAILFIFVAVKKFRMGLTGYAEDLVAGDALINQEFPLILLYIYGIVLPIAELAVGVLLLMNMQVDKVYFAIGLIYLTFILGQQYNGNTSKVGTEYIPSLLALSFAFFFRKRAIKAG